MNEAATPRSVLVTGGSRGIGRAICEHLRDAGHRVAAAGPSGSAPDGVLGIVCDVADPASVEEAFKTAEDANGPVEIVVANAGVTSDALIMRMSDEQWDQVMDVNLRGAFNVSRRAVKGMVRRRFGRVVYIGSLAGLYGNAGQVNYSASKSALVGMARSLTREVGKRGITFNVVAPGFIDTEMTAALPAEVVAEFERTVPMGRRGTTDDVASAVDFLVSDQAGYISGTVLNVDGGLGMGH